MNNDSKEKLAAAGKIAYGAARIVGGIAAATGHGLLGAYCQRHHMMNSAVRMGAEGAKSGMKSIEEGIEQWKRLG